MYPPICTYLIYLKYSATRLLEMWRTSGKLSSWDNDSVEAFVRNLEALMMFVSDRLRKGDIPHYFISTVNLATTMVVSSPLDDKKIKNQ